MAAATLTTLDAILKEFYPENKIREQLNHQAVLLYHAERKSQPVGGRRHIVPLHTGRGESVGARPEGGALPTPNGETWANSIVRTRFNYATGMVTGQAMIQSRGDAHAFAQSLDLEMRGKIANLRQDCNRQLAGDGSGVLSNCTAVTNSTVVGVASTKFLKAGMAVDVLTRSDGSVIKTNDTIASVSTANKTIAIGTAVTVTTDHSIYRHGSRNIEMMGINGIVSDGDPQTLNTTGYGLLQSLGVATYGIWKSIVAGAGGTARAIGFDEIQSALDDVMVEGGSVPDMFVCSFPVRRKLVREEIVDKRYAQGADVIMLEGGFSAYKFNGIPLVPDKDVGYWFKNDPGQLFGLSWDELAIYQDNDPGFIDETGAVLKQSLSNGAYTDQFEFQLRWYAEFITHKRNSHLVLQDIDVA
jgi:hypothetical protein